MPLGDHALLINFEQIIDKEIHRQVVALSNEIEAALIEGVTFILPAYCSITIGYSPQKIRFEELKPLIKDLWKKPASTQMNSNRLLILPVCYEEPYALDLLEISKLSGLNPEGIIANHCSQSYQVFMLGFLPGFPYLGILPEILQFPRKKDPRLQVPERSVGLAGAQTGIYPFKSPGGWNIIGRTPLPIFNAKQNDPFLFKTGDEVQFLAIGKEEYQMIEAEIADGAYNWDGING
jgi:inhibitor of KinA